LVGPAPATPTVFPYPALSRSGAAFSVTVTALDAFNNTATGYRGTAHFTSTDGQAVLPTNYTYTAADNGVHAFSLTLQTVGNQTVTATDTGAGAITATTGTISVSAPPSVASLVVNDGAAQRSRVTTITVTFNTTVNTSLLATA